MKKIILVAMLLFSTAWAYDYNYESLFFLADNILQDHNISMDEIEDSGLELRLGEVTGAGFEVKLSKLNGILIESDLIYKDEISNIQFMSQGPSTINNINAIEIGEKVIGSHQFIGVIIEK